MNLFKRVEMLEQNHIDSKDSSSLRGKLIAITTQFDKVLDIEGSGELDILIKKFESIQRPDDHPKVFVFGSEADFITALDNIKTWKTTKLKLTIPVVKLVKPKADALKDTFFYDSDLGFFTPSDFFVLYGNDIDIIQKIENSVSKQPQSHLFFDTKAYTDELPSFQDPYLLESVDLESREQILVGDKVMHPFIDKGGEIIIKMFKINY